MVLAQGEVSLDQLYEMIEDSSRFGAFDLNNATMAGQSERLSHILSVVREEGWVFLRFWVSGISDQKSRRGVCKDCQRHKENHHCTQAEMVTLSLPF